MITKDTVLPSYEELTVQEIEMSSPYLRAAAHHLGKYCHEWNNEFMMCKQETKDPRKCLNEGKEVTACSLNFFRNVKKNCAEEFTDYANCLDRSSAGLEFRFCRKSQAIFDSCMFEKLGLTRAPFGYFTEVQVHDTTRERPKPTPLNVFPGALPDIPPPEEFPKPGQKYPEKRRFL